MGDSVDDKARRRRNKAIYGRPRDSYCYRPEGVRCSDEQCSHCKWVDVEIDALAKQDDLR